MPARFWWGQRGSEWKVHWLSKQKLIKPKKEGGIGFRDIQLFNQALLARQGWRLLQHPSFLVCRVLKVKYFPHTSFLDAHIPCNTSFIWRSICEANEVLHQGLRWRVGSGAQIRIWQDKWISCHSTYKVISPRNILGEGALVEQLINRETMTWDVPLLRNVFLPCDIDIIQTISLSKWRPSDALIWNGMKSGIFSVKSHTECFLTITVT